MWWRAGAPGGDDSSALARRRRRWRVTEQEEKAPEDKSRPPRGRRRRCEHLRGSASAFIDQLSELRDLFHHGRTRKNRFRFPIAFVFLVEIFKNKFCRATAHRDDSALSQRAHDELTRLDIEFARGLHEARRSWIAAPPCSKLCHAIRAPLVS